MKQLRCEGPDCSLLTERARFEYENDLYLGRCLCHEACVILDRRQSLQVSSPPALVKVESEADLDSHQPPLLVGI